MLCLSVKEEKTRPFRVYPFYQKTPYLPTYLLDNHWLRFPAHDAILSALGSLFLPSVRRQILSSH